MSESAKQRGIPTYDMGQDVLWLMRIRDFLHLMLSYPMRIGREEYLKQLIDEIHLLLKMELHSYADDDPNFRSLRTRIEHLSEKTLEYVQVIIPHGIIEIIFGGGYITKTPVPERILVSASDLALHQLTLTLTSDDNIQNIWFSVRNDSEKKYVVQGIRANSHVHAAFDDLQIIGLNQIDYETERELGISAELITKDRRGRHLVLVVDGYGDQKVDSQKVTLPIQGDSQHVVVFITERSTNDDLSNRVDLTIQTGHHFLPWELFCRTVAWEIIDSSTAIERIAVQIVEKCGGHLLAIILMAKSLKGVEDVHTWKLSLEKLRYHNREVIVNAFFNVIWANVTSDREKVRLLRFLMVFKFQDWKMSDDELLARWFFEHLVDTEEEAEGILQNFTGCSVLLQFEDTLGRHIILPEDIRIILHAIGEEIPENLSEGAFVSTISDIQFLNFSKTLMRNLYAVNTQPPLKELNLEGCMMQTMPKAIFNLPQLETLSLKNCVQLLELPPAIAMLENLRELRLDGCNQLETLPQEIWELQKLETLSLKWCKRLLELPPQIAKLENLRELRLDGCNQLETLPQEIWELQKLETLSLKWCKRLLELPPQIAKLENLKELRIERCERLKTPPQDIWELQNLEILSLKYCFKLPELSPAILKLENLRELRLKGCTELKTLPQDIWELQNLETLTLKDCSRLLELPPSISKLENLKKLKLHGCGQLETLPQDIWELQQLETLSLQYCYRLLELPPAIAKFDNLREFTLHGCPRLRTLPQDIWEAQKLETFSLKNCGELMELPPGIAKVENLRELRLNGCKRLKTLPQDIWELQKLEILSMINCVVLKLPPAIDKVEKVENLRELRLDQCESLKTLPQDIWELQKLEILSLSSCLELLELPPVIGEVDNLRELKLDGCKRLKILPLDIWKLEKLEILSLEYCSQLLELPPHIAKLENLRELRLDGCERLETLPRDIRELQNLETLSLENCSQWLELSPAIAKLENLRELRLDGCKRLETLLQEIWELPNLQTLSLVSTSIFPSGKNQEWINSDRLPHSSSGYHEKSGRSKKAITSSSTAITPLKIKVDGGFKQFEQLSKKIMLLQIPNIEECDLSDIEFSHLPRFINFPNLRRLLLGNNLNLMKIPSSFFNRVPLLSILDLSRTSIHELPSSIFNLEHLTELYLKDCELFVELPPDIRRLENLTTLDLNGTLITHLPKEIQWLGNLKSLSLSLYDDSSPEVIPPGVLSHFRKLGCLRIDVNSDSDWWLKNIERILEEIHGLWSLKELEMYIPEVDLLKSLRRRRTDFRFIVGHHKPRMISRVPRAIEVIFKKKQS